MPLPPINLDDRRFDDLLEEGRRQIQQSCPAWTDLSPSDPGMVLLDVFAHLTEVMLYRLNRLPDKVYVELLNLLGVNLQPPAAAVCELQFDLRQPLERDLEIPRGTRVTVARAGGGEEPPVFSTLAGATIPHGETEVRVRAIHAEFVDGELVGTGTGSAGIAFQVQRPPIVSAAAGGPELVVAVEVPAGTLPVEARGVQHDGKTYRVWREVENFTELGEDRHVFVVDREQGRIQFAPRIRVRDDDASDAPLDEMPQALGEVPPAGAAVRAWYWRGGGVAGNVAAHTLTVLKDAIPGLTVTNPEAGVGGRSAESLDNALARGPQEIHSLKRAVTARDFEICALRTGTVDRAYAYTKAALWHHAAPGTVEVLLLPHVPPEARGTGPVTADVIHSHCERNQSQLPRIQQELDARRPLGTQCLVNWAHCKPVQVRAEVVVFREENPAAVTDRLLANLNRFINPLPSLPEYHGWECGQPLTSWHIYRMIGSEPGVKTINRMCLVVDDVPAEDVSTLAADSFQSRTWYAGSRDKLYRTVNDGRGWEPIRDFPDERIVVVKPYDHPSGNPTQGSGLLAVATAHGQDRARIHLSRDCGESWKLLQPTAFPISDIAWIDRHHGPALLLTTDRGLFELAISEDADPVPLVVDTQNQGLGFYRVAVSSDGRGDPVIAVAARDERGVFLSTRAGAQGSFELIGLENRLVRILAIQQRGPNRYLWAGFAAPGRDAGKGCSRWRLTSDTSSPGGWEEFGDGWAEESAGSCLGLSFLGDSAFAATRNRGVLRIDTETREPRWQAPDVNCGLPLREMGRLQPVDTIATNPAGDLMLVGGRQGVYRSEDRGIGYVDCSRREFETEVTLPPNWFFCSGAHDLKIVIENESG